jgi:uncharacterized protein YoxC
MDKTLEEVFAALDELGDFVSSRNTEARLLVEVQGWHSPAITREELADIPKALARQIHKADIDEIPEELQTSLEDVPHKLKLVQKHTVAQFFGGNSHQAIPAYMTTIQWISVLVQPLLYWESMQDPKAMPPMLAKRLRSVKKQLDEVSVDKTELLSQIEAIQNATEAAESLPADLISLRDAREKVSKLSDQSIKDSEKIDELKVASIANGKLIDARIEQADKLINQCEEAYRITTTKGLAGAFEERANRLSRSMWVWVSGLLGALVIGAIIGSERLKYLTTAMNAESPDIGIIIMQSVLSILSLGAPLWFAWIATKQIGQRFKLSEDYAFKASVAKAYEGYRKEAARIDPAFEARLFSTALTRVEEAPLRLVDEENHGSPWQELVSSPAFQEALDSIPEFRDKFIKIAKEGAGSFKNLTSSNKKAESKPSDEGA